MIQLTPLEFVGTSSATRRKGTGSQLRLRNRTAPIFAAVVCSEAEVCLVGAGEIIARKLTHHRRFKPAMRRDRHQLYIRLARNSLTTVLNAAGRSMFDRCPAP